MDKTERLSVLDGLIRALKTSYATLVRQRAMDGDIAGKRLAVLDHARKLIAEEQEEGR